MAARITSDIATMRHMLHIDAVRHDTGAPDPTSDERHQQLGTYIVFSLIVVEGAANDGVLCFSRQGASTCAVARG